MRWHDEGLSVAVMIATMALLALTGSGARAQESAHANREPAGLLTYLDENARSPTKANTAPDSNRSFGKGTWTLEPFGFALTGLDDKPELDLYGGGVGANYYLEDGFALRGELYGIGVDQTGDNTYGGGLNLLGRWHFLREPNWSLFAEGGGGLLQTETSLPAGNRGNVGDGTHFNFTSHLGLGATYRLGQRSHLVSGLRFTHISNADIAGDDENPGTNAIGGYVGMRFKF
jgi:hypothetical protein